MSSTFLQDLVAEVQIPPKGTLSRVLFDGQGLRVVGFGFDVGEELTEHTSAMPVVIQVVKGRLKMGLGGDPFELGPEGWLHLPARQPHSVEALEPTIMLLTMLRGG
ncbi:MAG: cupin domain-containing protein [Dehalococcoidia bacterium]